MKKNTKTYLLLGAVAIIWGIIGYRIIGGMGNTEFPKSAIAAVTFKPLPTKEKKRFSILADYRDPFLGTLPKKPVKKTKRISKIITPVLPEIQIEYIGFIGDKNSKQNIFFVSINGTQHLMSPTNEIKKVKLVSGTTKSIKVRYNNKTRTIALEE